MSSEKALNELKKATMASYLAKAGKAIRSSTSIAASFDDDYHKHLKAANKNHPNVMTPGYEKDPDKLARAEKGMQVSGELRDKFAQGAKNRIKGIARAGRLLAKEETLNERNTESHPELWDTHELRHESGKALKKGDVVKDFRGDKHKIKGFELPHHSGSTGRVYTNQGSFFPGVVDAKIVKKKAVKEDAEPVNELKTSTLAKVATARYKQAQQALKDKNYPEYAKKIQKSHKAADATVPKKGWSVEEEAKTDGVSAQEKYRQIREAKVRKGVTRV